MSGSEFDELEECLLSDDGASPGRGDGQYYATSPLSGGRSRATSGGGRSQDGFNDQLSRPGPNQAPKDGDGANSNYTAPSYSEAANADADADADDNSADESTLTADSVGNKSKPFRSIRKVRKHTPLPTPTAPTTGLTTSRPHDLTTSRPHDLTTLGVFEGHGSIGRPLQEEHVAATREQDSFELHRKQ